MIKWCENDKVRVEFDDVPHVSVRYAVPSMTDSEIKAVKKYPFINKKNLTVLLYDKVNDRFHGFDIPKGYCFDGASIPRFFWRVIGAPTCNEFLIASLIHDVLCENHQYIMDNREFSTEVFNVILEGSKVGKVKRYLMKHSVDIFQKLFCKWGKDNGKN